MGSAFFSLSVGLHYCSHHQSLLNSTILWRRSTILETAELSREREIRKMKALTNRIQERLASGSWAILTAWTDSKWFSFKGQCKPGAFAKSFHRRKCGIYSGTTKKNGLCRKRVAFSFTEKGGTWVYNHRFLPANTKSEFSTSSISINKNDLLKSMFQQSIK